MLIQEKYFKNLHFLDEELILWSKFYRTDDVENFTVTLVLSKAIVDEEKINFFKAKFENEMEKRRNLTDEVCKSHKSWGKFPVNRKEYYYLKNQSLLWCPVFKAASTSWIENLFTLQNLSSSRMVALEKKFPNQLDRQLRLLSPIASLSVTNLLNKSNTTKSVIVTRHPFRR